MSDTCYIELRLMHPASAKVAQLIEEHLGTPSTHDGAEAEGSVLFAWDDAIADMPDEFILEMIRANAPFAWTHGSGDDFTPGVTLCDGRRSVYYPADTQGEILLPMKLLTRPVQVAKAIEWGAFHASIQAASNARAAA